MIRRSHCWPSSRRAAEDMYGYSLHSRSTVMPSVSRVAAFTSEARSRDTISSVSCPLTARTSAAVAVALLRKQRGRDGAEGLEGSRDLLHDRRYVDCGIGRYHGERAGCPGCYG